MDQQDDLEGTEDLRDGVERLLAENFFDGFAKVVAAKFKGRSLEEAQDAISEVIRRIAATGHGKRVDNVRNYLLRSATRQMLRMAERQVATSPLDEGESAESTPFEDDVSIREIHAWLKELVRRWENQNIRAVMLVTLDAAYYKEDLTLKEIGERAGELLGEVLSQGSIGTWQARGARKLAAELRELGVWCD